MGACRALKPFGKKRSILRCHTRNTSIIHTKQANTGNTRITSASACERAHHSVDRAAPPPPLHEPSLGQGLGVNKERDMVGPLPTDVHKPGA